MNHLLFCNYKQTRQNFVNIATEDEAKEKIWNIAKERYKGWRSALSATYKAYNNYGERIRNSLKNYTFLSGTTCYCILDLMDSRLVLKKSTWSTKIALLHSICCHLAEGW